MPSETNATNWSEWLQLSFVDDIGTFAGDRLWGWPEIFSKLREAERLFLRSLDSAAQPGVVTAVQVLAVEVQCDYCGEEGPLKDVVDYVTRCRIENLFAAPAPAAAPGGETPERPPMLRAKRYDDSVPEWFIRHALDAIWCGSWGSWRSEEFDSVNRECSDPAALWLYDKDMAASNSPPPSPPAETPETEQTWRWCRCPGLCVGPEKLTPERRCQIYHNDVPPTLVASEETPKQNVRGLKVKYGDVCEKCGFSSCDHNEDPVDNCPNPDRVDLDNYTVFDAPVSPAAYGEVERLRFAMHYGAQLPDESDIRKYLRDCLAATADAQHVKE